MIKDLKAALWRPEDFFVILKQEDYSLYLEYLKQALEELQKELGKG